MQRISKVPIYHVLHHIASDHLPPNALRSRWPLSLACDNIAILQVAIKQLTQMCLHDINARIGNRLLDSTSHVSITIPAVPPHSSKVFQQWASAWMHKSQSDLLHLTGVGSDGLYSTKGQGTSAFVIQRDNIIIHTHSFSVVAHSSFDVEMHAANVAIDYILDNIQGQVLMFIDNQATLKSLFSTKPHTAFQLALSNCKNMFKWLSLSPDNTIEFRWMPSHLGFPLNELADKAVKTSSLSNRQ